MPPLLNADESEGLVTSLAFMGLVDVPLPLDRGDDSLLTFLTSFDSEGLVDTVTVLTVCSGVCVEVSPLVDRDDDEGLISSLGLLNTAPVVYTVCAFTVCKLCVCHTVEPILAATSLHWPLPVGSKQLSYDFYGVLPESQGHLSNAYCGQATAPRWL